jgi:hypothetical protein
MEKTKKEIMQITRYKNFFEIKAKQEPFNAWFDFKTNKLQIFDFENIHADFVPKKYRVGDSISAEYFKKTGKIRIIVTEDELELESWGQTKKQQKQIAEALITKINKSAVKTIIWEIAM